MGGSNWQYFVAYEQDIQAVFEQLQHDVFTAGAYRRDGFSKHQEPESIAQLREMAGIDGTHSLLDVVMLADKPVELIDPQIQIDLLNRVETQDQFFELALRIGKLPFPVLYPLTRNHCLAVYGVEQPTRYEVEKSPQFANDKIYFELSRSNCYYLTIYKNGEPNEIMFVGFTGD